jgi:hypothetical protein
MKVVKNIPYFRNQKIISGMSYLHGCPELFRYFPMAVVGK